MQASDRAQPVQSGTQPRGAASGRAETSSTNAPAVPAVGDVDRMPRQQVFLRGPICAGKSTALAMLVAWARASDWVVSCPGPALPFWAGPMLS